jgi:phage gp36-like protein
VAYAAKTDLELAAGGAVRLLQLADYSGTGVVNADVVASAIAEAESIVNKSIQLRYNVPLLEPVPGAVRALVAREAVWLMKLARDMTTEADLVAHEERRKMLEDIGAGRMSLGVYPSPLKSSAVVDRTSGQDETAAVSRESLKGFA